MDQNLIDRYKQYRLKNHITFSERIVTRKTNTKKKRILYVQSQYFSGHLFTPPPQNKNHQFNEKAYSHNKFKKKYLKKDTVIKKSTKKNQRI